MESLKQRICGQVGIQFGSLNIYFLVHLYKVSGVKLPDWYKQTIFETLALH